jgi:tetratricopeptide (TPR) repeat protein
MKRQRAVIGTRAPERKAVGDPDTRRLAFAALALGVLALLVYGNAFSAGLVLDNKPIIELDPRVHTWNADTLGLIFTRNYWYPQSFTDLYRPLTTLSYWVNYTLIGNGTRVAGYHAVNLVLHWANACFVLLIVGRLTQRFALALAAAALFVVHPVNTEAVTNIVGRADLFATLSILAGGWCYVRATAATGRRRTRLLSGMALSAFLGVFTKETAVLIGVFVLLYDGVWRFPALAGATVRERLRVAGRAFGLKGYVWLLPAAIAAIIVRVTFARSSVVISEPFVANPIAGATWFSGFMTAWKVIGRYMGLLVFPHVLSTDYSYNQIPLYGEGGGAWETAQAWLALALVIVLLSLAVRLRKSHTLFAWGTCFFFLTQLPTANLLVPIGTIMAERFMYLPSVGFCAVAALALMWAGARVAAVAPPNARTVAQWSCIAVAVAALGVRTHTRNRDWHDQVSLMKSAVEASPRSYKAYEGYANARLVVSQDEATLDSAIAGAERSYSILETPKLPVERQGGGPLFSLGLYYRLKGQKVRARGDSVLAKEFLKKSVAMLERARDLNMWFTARSREARIARSRDSSALADVGDYTIYVELANAYLETQQWTGARNAGRYAQHLQPDAQQAYQVEGTALFYEHHADSGAVAIAMALLLDPRRGDIWENLASCFRSMGLPPPIVRNGDAFAFDPASPLTGQLLTRAAAGLVSRFEEARRFDDARAWRERLMREYRLPAQVFAPAAIAR